MAIQPLGTGVDQGTSIQPLGSTPAVQHTFGDSMKVLGDLVGGATDFVNNNPVSKGITSLAALPVQLLAKGMGQPDPFAGGIGTGPGAAQVTSSDQPVGKFLESEAGNALSTGSLLFPPARAAEAVTPFLSALGRFAPATARVATQTALGTAQGLAGGMQQGQSGSELKGSGFTGALLGGGLSTAGEFGSSLLANFAKNTPTGRLGEQTNRLKTLQNSFDDNSTFVKDAKTGTYL